MQRPIKIGVLCPYSSIYPNLSSDFTDGLLSALPSDYQRQIELIPEYVSQGGSVATKSAFNKLTSFHRVDLITGFTGYRVVPDFITSLEGRNVIGLFADMGELIPDEMNMSDNLFFNSLQFWQAEYAFGHWAKKQFDGKGLIFLSLYEAGYHMHNAFQEGYFMAVGSEIDVYTIPLNRAERPVMLEYFADFIETFRKEKPAFIHPLFSGHEAVDFIGLYYEQGLHKDVPIVLSPHMGSDEVLAVVSGVNTNAYSASIWSKEEENEENKRFKQAVINQTGLATNTPTLLGYEIGLALKGVFRQLLQRDLSEVKKILKEQRIQTPRGERTFYLDSNYATPNITIEKVMLQDSSYKRLAIDEGRSLSYDHHVFSRMRKLNVSGWLNTYLCI